MRSCRCCLALAVRRLFETPIECRHDFRVLIKPSLALMPDHDWLQEDVAVRQLFNSKLLILVFPSNNYSASAIGLS